MGPRELLALAVNRTALLRPRERISLLESCGTPELLCAVSHADLSRLLGRPVSAASWRPLELLRQAERDWRDLTRAGFMCTFYWDPAFPSLLKEIYDPPVVLYSRGVLPEASRPLVAVVGTRKPSGAAREKAYELGFELGRAGVATVSGLARGIDAEAHRGTVDAGGYTIGILGNGIDQVCPYSSRALARRILEHGGAVASEYPPGEPPEAMHFPARNRIISGMARSVVVVQAPLRSGALITAEYALEQDRDLLVHAVGLCGFLGAGSRGLWLQGALAVRSAADVLGLLGEGGRLPAALVEEPQSRLEEPERRLEEPQRSREGDRLARQVELELAGEIVVRGGKTYWKVEHGRQHGQQ